MRPESRRVNRREFLTGALALVVFDGRALVRGTVTDSVAVHPEPRPGITADHVRDPATFKDKPRVADLYRLAKQAPQILDGLHCYCECHDSMKHRSLLVCFESDQPAGCYACGSQARLALKLHREGKSLAEIRAACDRKFG